MRRVLFGLTAIIRTSHEHLPSLVAHKLPDIFKEIGQLTVKQFNERKDCVEQNEKAIEKGMPDDDDNEYDSEDDDVCDE